MQIDYKHSDIIWRLLQTHRPAQWRKWKDNWRHRITTLKSEAHFLQTMLVRMRQMNQGNKPSTVQVTEKARISYKNIMHGALN